MQALLDLLKRCAENHTFDTGDPDNRTVLDQLFCAYQDSHETDPPEIKDGFKELASNQHKNVFYDFLLCLS